MNVRQKLQLATSVSVVAYFGIASTENDNKHEISVVGLSGCEKKWRKERTLSKILAYNAVVMLKWRQGQDALEKKAVA